MVFSKEMVQKVWEKGRVDSNQDPSVWRKDECGAWIRHGHYGNQDSEFGWEIDHITAVGPDDLSNLRVLQWQRSYGARLYPVATSFNS